MSSLDFSPKSGYIYTLTILFSKLFRERIMGQQRNKIEKRNRRKAYLARVRERIKAQIKK